MSTVRERLMSSNICGQEVLFEQNSKGTHAIPSHGLRIGKDTYEANVPSCPLPFLIFCIAPETCKRQA